MSEVVLSRLPELRPDSGVRLSSSVVTGMTRSLERARYQLMRTTVNPNGPGFLTMPRGGWDNIETKLQDQYRVMTVADVRSGGFTASLNSALSGGESYPVLNAILGTAAGAISGGAGLLFTVATTAVDVSRRVSSVLARGGDEIWCVEAIGKYRGDAIHVGSFFLVDPFRSNRNDPDRGWLIHEERHELTLP